VGYLLLGILSRENFQIKAGISFYYLMGYALASLILFIGIINVCEEKNNYAFSSFDGLAKRNKGLSLMLTIAVISLAGIPITAGFMAKYLLLTSLFHPTTIYLVYIALFASAIGAFYYLKLIQAMYFKNAEDNAPISISFNHQFTMFVCLILMILISIFPLPFITSITGF
jgi:NADH-quinone oxidoreductase subunit N